MNLYINCISADNIMRCKKGSEEVLKHIKLTNPQIYQVDVMRSDILFDVLIELPDNYIITSYYNGNDEYIKISLSKLGDIELSVKDFRDITIN